MELEVKMGVELRDFTVNQPFAEFSSHPVNPDGLCLGQKTAASNMGKAQL